MKESFYGKFISPLKAIFKTDQTTGYLLMISVALAIIAANSPLHHLYSKFVHTSFGISIAQMSFSRDLHFWVNDGLMTIFFLFIGLEIKRELIVGELSSFQKSFLPVAAALGGMTGPAFIFLAFNANSATANGWGIPIATDIAFALGILSLLGKRIPLSLKIFLAALAIVDDIGAILVIAIFYTDHILMSYLMYASATLLALIILNRLQILNYLFYLPLGVLLWYFTYKSGVHATISGVLLAFTIPLIRNNKNSPLEKMENALHEPVGYLIMPLFAFVNTGIVFQSSMIEGLHSSLSLGIILGLFLGKPIGIVSFSWLAVKMKVASLPSKVKWNQIAGIGFLGGIGFTMSIFIALLSFSQYEAQEISKLAILIASLLSGIVGFIILKILLKDQYTNEEPAA